MVDAAVIDRMNACNQLVREIAACGRKFFDSNGRVGGFEVVDENILWRDQYTNALIAVVANKSDPKFSNGSTLRNFVADMRQWVLLGKPTEAFISRHWGYPDSDIERLLETGRDMRLIAWDDEILARANTMAHKTVVPHLPTGATLGYVRGLSEWTIVAEWPMADGGERSVVLAEGRQYKADLADMMKHLKSLPRLEPMTVQDNNVLQALHSSNASRPENSVFEVEQTSRGHMVAMTWHSQSGAQRSDTVDGPYAEATAALRKARRLEALPLSPVPEPEPTQSSSPGI